MHSLPYPMRLQKFLARAGVASRRGSENLMTSGRVTINGVVVSELGSKVDPATDEVRIDGKVVTLAHQYDYLMMNKPAGYLTTMSDPLGRNTVADLLPEARAAGLFPVGRLDFDTTGLLLFMTDGELAHQLLHPRHHVPKSYVAAVDGVLTEEDAEQLREGVALHDGMTKPALVEILSPLPDVSPNGTYHKQLKKPNSHERILLAAGELPVMSTVARITISEGRKRQVKRMFAHVDHPVVSLHRESFGPLELGDLLPGECRALTEEEIAALRGAL
ncbi:MAG: rRNA pseudouridine synthase [Coriobacteriales bacterium]|jgi:23S rRNA pseudouridine2605 synthase|nr:rRNA pseudouridine synthase [Coriobacteriales bacterium]